MKALQIVADMVKLRDGMSFEQVGNVIDRAIERAFNKGLISESDWATIQIEEVAELKGFKLV